MTHKYNIHSSREIQVVNIILNRRKAFFSGKLRAHHKSFKSDLDFLAQCSMIWKDTTVQTPGGQLCYCIRQTEYQDE